MSKQTQTATYHHLGKEKKKWKGKTQPMDLKIVPTDKPCTRSPSLFCFGKPQRCNRPGYVKVGEVVFCKKCFFSWIAAGAP